MTPGISGLLTDEFFVNNGAYTDLTLENNTGISGIVFMFLGIAMLGIGVNRVILTLIAVISPKDELVDEC